MFFYNDTGWRDKGSLPDIDPWKMNGTKGYMRHYENKLFLKFMAQKGTQQERWQAEKELVICERKLAWWEKHPNTDRDQLQILIAKMNKDWSAPV